MDLLRKIWALSTLTFVWYPRRSLAAVALLVGVAVMDALSVVSLIPAIEYLSKAAEVSRFSFLLNGYFDAFGIPKNLVTYFTLSAFVIVGKSVLRYFAKSLLIKIQMDFELKLSFEGVNALLRADSRCVEEMERGHIINLLTLEVQKVGECLFYIYDYFALALKFLFYFSVLLAFSVPLVFTILVTSVLTMVPSMLLGRAIFRASEQRLQNSSSVLDYLGQLTNGVFEIKAYSAESFFSQIYRGKQRTFKTIHGRMLLLQDLTGVVLEPFGIVQIIIIVYLALDYFGLSFPETLVVLFTLRNVLPLFGQMMSYKQVIISSLPSFTSVQGIVQDLLAHSENHAGPALPGFKTSLSLKNVGFSYQKGQILHDINLEVPKGSSVALVGVSGSGKSTLLKILLGVLRPQSGTVQADGTSIFDVSIDSWRTHIGFVPQEPILLRDTLRQNIAIGQTQIDDIRLNHAVAQANLTDLVKTLPQGLDTVLGEKGMGLSTGQKQRVSIARMLYKNPEIVLLDEATSALDAESEAYIKNTIEGLKHEKTFVIIAHRLSTIKFCDQIHVMEAGRIIESGSYDQLMSLQGKFTSLVQAQGPT